uniref:TruB_N domain-containing protein n=1 Tax=Panagrellus redivivus TaxID=6233 RepID=A0A7E4UMK1_PANRE
MCGRAFVAQDLMLEQINELEPSSSGVCAFAVGPECYEIDSLRQRAWINSYRMEAKLGEETEKHAIRGRIIVRAEWDHVTRHKVEKLLTRLRAQYKRASFKLAEVDLQSQEAFELARRGAPRPKILDSPIVYDISVSSFRTPYFSMNLQVTGETDYFLRALVHEIGLSVGSTACTKKLQRIRLGPFGVDHALLEKDFGLKSILRNILMCNKVLKVAAENEGRVVQVKKVADLESAALLEAFSTKAEEEPEPEDCLRIAWGREYSTV